MTTRQLYYLVTIADLGTLSGAAQILGISQPALSKFLAEYEDSLGFHLFLRYHRVLTPTAVGRYVISCAQKILDEQTRMLQSLRTLTDNGQFMIRLATAPNRGAILYSHIYKPFSRRYPEISLSLTELFAKEQPGAIQYGQIDLAIGSGDTSKKVSDIPFAYEELLLALPRSHPLADRKKISLTELKDTPFVLQGPHHNIRTLADRLFKEAGFSPVVTFESNDVLLVDSMLHQAVGAGFVSKAHVAPCKELVYLSLDPPVFQNLHLRYPLGHILTEPEQFLAGLLMRERLSDARYTASSSKEAKELIQLAKSFAQPETDSQEDFPSMPIGAAQHTAPQINLSTPLLKYIIAIVDEKSLTKAAEKFYLSQPALSRYLHNAEEMVCAQLFTRIHNRLQPTNAGKVFVNFARNMLQIETEMEAHIQAYLQGHGGGLYLQCDPELATIIQEKVMNVFSSMHPSIRLHIVEGNPDETQDALLNASADCGLYFSRESCHSVLNSQVIAGSALVYCMAKNRDNEASGQLPEGYMPERLMLAMKGSALRTEQERLLSSLWSTSFPVICEAETSVLVTLAQLGAADTILPEALLSQETLSRCCSLPGTPMYYLLKAVHPSRTFPAPAKDLWEMLNCCIMLPHAKSLKK